jgi:ribokinase
MARVIVVGSLNMDLIVRASRRPSVGETVLGDGFRILPGGKGLNQAVAAARLGAATHMTGCTGDDQFGRELLAFLGREGVDCARVRRVADVATGVGIVMLADSDNAIIVAPGANMMLTAAEASAHSAQRGDICVGQLEVPLAATEAAFHLARVSGAMTILNAAPAQRLSDSFLEVTDLLVVNESELKAMSGRHIDEASPDSDIVTAARMLARDRRGVIATLGARGAIAVDGAAVVSIPGRKVQVVDTTGAGDCFVGALAAFLADGADRRTAIYQANDAAALSVQRPGAAPSMPTISQLRNAFS